MTPLAPPVSRPLPTRVPRWLADPLIREIGSWLDGPDPERVRPAVRGWDERTAAAARRLITAHGIAPALAREPSAEVVRDALPDELRTWLGLPEARNHERIGRLLEELREALRAFDRAGIAVMPLKGAILATRPGRDPYRRPMADLDLLVAAGDRDRARAALAGLGYRRRPDRTRRPTHDTFERPGNDRVVEVDGEHPDNPRRIELHVEVKRHLWGWVDDDDLTAVLWAGAAAGRVLGEAALLPAERAFVAHLAIHATSDLLLERGRLVQWLDLADVAGPWLAEAAAADELDRLPHARMLLPALRLASRRLAAAFPSAGTATALERLERRVPPALARWAATVPLDRQAGLQAGRLSPADVSTLAARWTRWAPARWRLLVAYGDRHTAVALAAHLARIAATPRRRHG